MAVTASWRIVMAVWGIVAHGLVKKGPYGADNLMHRGWPANPLTYLVDAGVRMDGFWYAGIARHGYAYASGLLKSIAYFPLYPALIKAVSLVFGNVYVAGMLISTVSLFVAIWALQAWLDQRGFGSSSALAAGLMLCFPVGFFWAAMYTESLFLALALGAFVFFERDRWLLSSACAFLAVLCRPTGLILAPALALLAAAELSRFRFLNSKIAEDSDSRPAPRDPQSAWWGKFLPFAPAVAGPLAYAAFALYQWIAFGNPLATVKADQAPPFSRNLGQALSDLTLHRPGFPPWYLAGLLVLGLAFLAAVPLVYRRFGAGYALFAALAVLLPMSTGLVSLERYVLIDFPVFAALALVKRRVLPVALAALGFYLCVGLFTLFVNGYTII